MRFWLRFIGEANLTDAQRAQIPAKRAAGLAALQLMEEHLADHDWFVGDGVTLADIALYPYTHVAGDGGFDLADYPSVGRWLKRVEALPGFVPMG